MIGEYVGYKGGGDLLGMFKRSGWKCVCKTTSQDDSIASSSSSSSSQSVRAKPHDTSQTFRRKAKSKYRTSAAASPDIEDTTTSGKFLINNDFELGIVNETPTIIISNKRGANALPEYLMNRQFITKVGDHTVGTLNNIGDFYKLLESNDFYDKPVVLTVARGGAGGFGPQEFKVQVILKRDIMPRQGSVGGGKKTTYWRKKHVTRRKINTKRRKVMVGGEDLHKEVKCYCTKKIKGTKQPEEGESESKGEGVSESVSVGVEM